MRAALEIIRCGKKEFTTEDTEDTEVETESQSPEALAFSLRAFSSATSGTLLQRTHVGEEFAVASGLAELVDQQFHGFDG